MQLELGDLVTKRAGPVQALKTQELPLVALLRPAGMVASGV